MRAKNALRNMIASILLELTAAVSGILLPRFFIATYGSSVYGLVSSIGQFITYMGLVEAGVGAAAIIDLYKPLADGDNLKISEIVSAARGFYNRLGIIFLSLDAVLILGYPYIVRNEISDASFVRMMILVLSIVGFVNFFLVGKYHALLIADQKSYIIAFAQTVGNVVTLAVSIVMIELEISSILVKGVVGLVYFLRAVYLAFYVGKHYPGVSFRKPYTANVFSQRNAALFHQVVTVICDHTDVILLTVMMKKDALVEVSVYSTYYMIGLCFTQLFNSISQGIRASFGNIIVSNDEEALQRSFGLFELVYFNMLYISYTCIAVLMLPFISLYSKHFADASVYPRAELVVLFTACGILQNSRIPGLTINLAAGHYKQTRWAAALELLLNLGVSVTLVRILGIPGVLIGTIVAFMFRTTFEIVYNAKHFVHGTLGRTGWRILRNFLLFLAIALSAGPFVAPLLTTWYRWFGVAVIVGLGTAGAFLLLNYITEPATVRQGVDFLRRHMRRKTAVNDSGKE